MEEFILHTMFPIFLAVLLTGASIVLGICIAMMIKDFKEY